MKRKAYYVILENEVLLTKKKYHDWRDIQNEFTDYKASLGPWSDEETQEYFALDYKEEKDWPFSRKRIGHYFSSDELVLFECGAFDNSVLHNIKFKMPWQNENSSTFQSLSTELEKELHEEHLLWGKKFYIIARRHDQDDVLIHIQEDNIGAIVHLTWKMQKENGKFPRTRIFRTINELNVQLDYDSQEYGEEI